MRLLAATAVMPAFAGIHDLETAPLKKVVDTRTASGHDGRSVGSLQALLALTALAAPAAALADEAPDLAKYNCTRADDGKTVSGDRLLADGFRIVSVGRFGEPNVMLAEPKSNARANCFVRRESH